MFIIVESGSTKADWVVVNGASDQQFYKTTGINPSTQLRLPDLSINTGLNRALTGEMDIFFYGAGADHPESAVRIKSWLHDFGFTGCVFVESDMIAAARACCGDSGGIVCILGTGSNSCVYDGNKIVNTIPSLGYIFSDEGGGVHLGKEIIKAFFYGTMPENEKHVFTQNYNLTKSDIIENVYKAEGGSRYIAAFADFLTHLDSKWKDDLILKVFRQFVSLRIARYTESHTMPIYFVGSVAYYYKNYLDAVLAEFDLVSTTVLQQPIFKLIDYHIKKESK